MACVNMREEVLSARELARRAIFARAEGARPKAGAHVAVLPQQAQPMLEFLCDCLPMLPLDDCAQTPYGHVTLLAFHLMEQKS